MAIAGAQVLVDLPGIIQHQSQGMHTGTKTAIMDMCQRHIRNPNAIILCIQDASRDAEGSSIADIVRAPPAQCRATHGQGRCAKSTPTASAPSSC